MKISGFLATAFLFILSASSSHAEFYKYGDPRCEQCKAGEYLEIIHESINHGEYVYQDDPPCGDISSATDALGKALIEGANSYSSANVTGFVGSVSSVARAVGIGGSVGSILSKYGNDAGHASCKPVCGALPADAKVAASRVLVSKAYDNHESEMEQVGFGQKGAGWAHVFYPVSKEGSICVVVSNWSHDKDRRVMLMYWFSSPNGIIEER